jgi:hypothetical protein
LVFTAVDVVRVVEPLGREVDDDGRPDVFVLLVERLLDDVDGRTHELVELVKRLRDVDDGRAVVVREVEVVVLGVAVVVREFVVVADVVVALRVVVDVVGRAGNVVDLRASEVVRVVVDCVVRRDVEAGAVVVVAGRRVVVVVDCVRVVGLSAL